MGRDLGSMFIEITGGAGERRVLATGMAGGKTVSMAAARVPYAGALTQITLLLGPVLPNSDRDDIPDVIDDDCREGGCGQAAGDAGVTDGGPDAPVTSGPVDAAAKPLELASPCGSNAACASGFCVDGVCCESACTGACFACNLQGAAGRCEPVAVGEDPGGDCAQSDEKTCGTDGVCDGKGACRKWAEGTTCAAATCNGTSFTPTRTCDGAGICRPANTTTCGGFKCASPEACHTSCTDDTVCSAGNVCTDGVCSGPRPLGAVCMKGEQCASGECHQGVCCNMACTTACYACNLAKSRGSCVPVAAGDDPLDQCASSAATTCGLDGACDGAGKCRKHASGTMCAAEACTQNTYAAPRTCDGQGACRQAVQTVCAPFTCQGSKCRSTCAMDGDCAAGAFCAAGGVCEPKRGDGEACTEARACASGQCVGGICCDSACGDLCKACNLTGSVGKCRPVPAGEDPRGQCEPELTSTCGQDGTCDGAGACRRWSAGTVCTPGVCSAGTATPPSTCDGAGACKPAATVGCGKYQCGVGACATTCTTQAECVAPSICAVGTCGGLRADYFTGQDLTTLVLTRTDGRVDFSWGMGVPAPGVPADNFSVRWTGTLTPNFSETYTLTIGADDGFRLYLDDMLLAEDWTLHPYREISVQRALVAGRAYAIKIEYYENTANAEARLQWQSASQPLQVVPAGALTPPP